MVMTTNKPKDPNRPVKVLIAEAMVLQPEGETAMRHVEVGERISIPLKDARSCNAHSNGRVLYLEPSDALNGEFIADAAAVKRVDLMAERIKVDREQRQQKAAIEAGGGALTPAMMQQIAATVAATLQQVMKP